MKRTYIVEDAGYNILEYCRTLRGAKSVCHRYGGHRIIAMRGTDFGEGFHMYYLILTESGFKRCKV